MFIQFYQFCQHDNQILKIDNGQVVVYATVLKIRKAGYD